jgi:site-specific DNA-cytosine methylase
VRLLAPRELLRLHGFPDSFGFPPGTSFREAQALVGNSVAVPVVALLLDLLLAPTSLAPQVATEVQ